MLTQPSSMFQQGIIRRLADWQGHVASITMSFQIFRTAMTNPADSLKYE